MLSVKSTFSFSMCIIINALFLHYYVKDFLKKYVFTSKATWRINLTVIEPELMQQILYAFVASVLTTYFYFGSALLKNGKVN